MEHIPKAVAAVAFLISLLLGLLSGAAVGWVIIKAFVFAGVFFGLAFGINVVFESFLSDGDRVVGKEEGQKAGNVDISVSDSIPLNFKDKSPDKAVKHGFDMPGSAGFAGSGKSDSSKVDSNKNKYEQLGNINNLLHELDKEEETGVEESVDDDDFISFGGESDDAPRGLEQNKKFSYNPVSSGEASSLDMDVFVPGLPGAAGVERSPVSSASKPETPSVAKTVEVSVARKPSRSIELSDLGRDVDGKKVASAIQNLLKKDEG